jgi:hypothetical protein
VRKRFLRVRLPRSCVPMKLGPPRLRGRHARKCRGGKRTAGNFSPVPC